MKKKKLPLATGKKKKRKKTPFSAKNSALQKAKLSLPAAQNPAVHDGISSFEPENASLPPNRFIFEKTLGTGGLCAVYHCTDALRTIWGDAQTSLAMKRLLPDYAFNPKANLLLMREFCLTRQLSHPHIIRVYDIHQIPCHELTKSATAPLPAKAIPFSAPSPMDGTPPRPVSAVTGDTTPSPVPPPVGDNPPSPTPAITEENASDPMDPRSPNNKGLGGGVAPDTPNVTDLPNSPDSTGSTDSTDSTGSTGASDRLDSPKTYDGPDISHGPTTPDSPNSPDTPDIQGIPDIPDSPDASETSNVQSTPDVPNIFDIPDTPDVPYVSKKTLDTIQKAQKLANFPVPDQTARVATPPQYALCMTMELLTGPSMADLIHEHPQGMGKAMLLLAKQLFSAIHYLHSHGIAHGDIKPANITLEPGNRLVLFDFNSAMGGLLPGFAEQAEGQKLRADLRLKNFTPLYASPERIEKGLPSFQDDIFTAACTLFHLAYGTRPYTTENALAARQTAQPLQNPLFLLPKTIHKLLCRALSFDPTARPNSGDCLRTFGTRAVQRLFDASHGQFLGQPSTKSRAEFQPQIPQTQGLARPQTPPQPQALDQPFSQPFNRLFSQPVSQPVSQPDTPLETKPLSKTLTKTAHVFRRLLWPTSNHHS